MSFKCWNDDPFTIATEVNEIDTFVGDGSDTSFPFPNKTVGEVGSTIQYSNVKKRLYDGGFTKTSTDVVIDSAPPVGVQGIIPGQGTFIADAYDQETVEGVSSPRVKEMSIFFGDIDDIHINYYTPRASASGIAISFVNLITSGGNPDTSIVQLACCDASGNALTYQATGTTLYTDQLAGFSTLAASAAAGATTILVTSATGTYYFVTGDFIKINTGENTQEIRRISSRSYNTLTLSEALSYSHDAGETVYSSIREVKAKFTIPANMTNNEAENFYNLVPRIQFKTKQRP